ncbi:MAG: polysaccharide pyruvyl transferase family protein [Bacteroidales bacterium]
MILTYYKEPNFGDAINPLIFNQLLPDFFDQKDQSLFLGIGSILGLFHGSINTRRIVVCSSGFAYGQMPELNHRYDIRCVRGPLTAKALKLPAHLAVTDGAVLLRLLDEFKVPVSKKYPFSFIPHHHSEKVYDQWQELLPEVDMHYISPRLEAHQAITQIRQSECIVAEAMHGAIIADAFRIPWIPVKMFQHINAFKWQDWMLSMQMKYAPHQLSSLFGDSWIRHMISTERFPFDKKGIIASALTPAYKKYQDLYKKKKFIRELKAIREKEPVLSNESLLESRVDQLQQILYEIRNTYTS